MFAPSYFGPRHFAPRYWPPAGDATNPPGGASSGAIFGQALALARLADEERRSPDFARAADLRPGQSGTNPQPGPTETAVLAIMEAAESLLQRLDGVSAAVDPEVTQDAPEGRTSGLEVMRTQEGVEGLDAAKAELAAALSAELGLDDDDAEAIALTLLLT